MTPPGPNQCIHNCIYCYAREAVYASGAVNLNVYNNLPELVEKDLKRMILCPPISISNISDPCQDIPLLKDEVERLIRLLMSYGVSFMVTTKGDPSFLLDIPGFARYEPKIVAVTIEGTDDVLKLLSPQAPDYARRLAFVRKLSTAGVKTVIRLDPLFKHLFRALYRENWFEYVEKIIGDFAEAGAGHIIASAGRLSKQRAVAGPYTGTSSWQRMRDLILKLSPYDGRAFEREYLYQDGVTARGCLLRYDLRVELHQKLKTCVENNYMTYAVCQELPSHLTDSDAIPNCEGYALPFSGKGVDGRFRPIAGCTANCHVSCAGLAKPRCGKPELVTARPLKLSDLKERFCNLFQTIILY